MRQDPASPDPAERMLMSLVGIRSDVGSDMKPVVECAAKFLGEYGIPVRKYYFSPDAPCLVARLKAAGDKGNAADSLVLHCHLDTAGFNRESWKADPVAGLDLGDRIYGRGTLDCKGLAAVWISIMGRLVGRNERLPFDVVLVMVSDEESDGQAGTTALLSETDECDKAFLAIGEGGGYPIRSGKYTYYTLQTGEMEEWRFRKAPEAHPGRGNLFSIVRAFWNGVYARETIAFALRDALGIKDERRKLAMHPFIQKCAQGNSWYRQPLGTVPRSFRRAGECRQIIETGTPGGTRPGLLSARRALRSVDGKARILPLATLGHSDNRHFRLKGIPTLGFFPLRSGNSLKGCHGDNEYITKASLRFAEDVLEAMIMEIKEAVSG